VTITAVILCIVCQLLIVVGQILLKMGLGNRETHNVFSRLPFALGIASLTCWFFLWLGLMGRWDLSKLYPFEGLNPAMMAIGAWFVLKEKLPVTAWVGVGLICVGIGVVSGS